MSHLLLEGGSRTPAIINNIMWSEFFPQYIATYTVMIIVHVNFSSIYMWLCFI